MDKLLGLQLRCAPGNVQMSDDSYENIQLATTSKDALFLEKARHLLHKRLKVRFLF